MSRELAISITSTQTVIKVDTTLNQTDFPIPGVIQIGSEKIRYNNLTDREFIDCVRGYDSTTAVAHYVGEDITYVSPIPHVATVVESIKADNEAELVGDVHLISGTNVTLTQTGNDITIDASGASWPLTATDYLDMDGNRIRLNTANTSYIENESGDNYVVLAHGGVSPFFFYGEASGADFGTEGDRLSIYADFLDTGTPNIKLESTTGEIELSATTLTKVTGGAAFSVENAIETDASEVAGDTRLLLWDVDSGALVKVTVGADDSGGTGFKVLRIPN